MKKRKKLAKISFSARGFARSLPDNTTGVLRTQRSLMCGFASSFLTATAECLCYSPKGQNREAKSPFHIRTADMLSTWDKFPQLRMTCAFLIGWSEAKKRELCTLSLATTAEEFGLKPDEWEYSWHLVPRRTSPSSSSSASLVRAFPSVAVPFATCVSRKCEIVEQRGGGKEGGRKEGREFHHRGGWRWRWWRWQAVYLSEVTKFSALLVFFGCEAWEKLLLLYYCCCFLQRLLVVGR